MPTIILGDLNSISEKDYSKQQLAEITEHRAKSGWEKPKSNVIKMFEDYGFEDLWLKCGGKSNQPTCWAKTRIDVRRDV